MFDGDLGFYRVGYETLFVRQVMHFVELFRVRSFFAAPLQFRMQLDFRDGQPPLGIFFHVADGFIDVFIEDELLLAAIARNVSM